MIDAAQRAASQLSNWELFWLATLGALATSILMFVLPELRVAYRAGNLGNWSKTKVALTPVLLILYSLTGALFGVFILGDKPNTIRGALLAGAKAPMVFKAFVAAGREATAKPDSS